MAYARACRQFIVSGTCCHRDCKALYLKSRSGLARSRNSTNDTDVGTWKHTARARCTFYIASEFVDAFFAGARSLVERDSDSMQDVICYMSGEHGLRYIQQLVEREFSSLPLADRRGIFQTQMAPFLETISHPKVLSSLVAEHALGVIYNFIYGVGGTRATNLFSSICSVLEIISEEDEIRAKWLEISLAVFCRIMFVNSTAFIQEGLGQQTSRLQDILNAMDNGNMERKLNMCRKYLGQLLCRIKIGAQMPSAAETEQHGQTQIITFAPLQEPPGGRHNNDHADFTSIQVLPTLEEILSPQTEYLPEQNPVHWHVRGLEGLLDRNFRLLREDSVGALRDAIHNLIHPPPEDTPRPASTNRNQLRTNTYTKAKIVKSYLYWSSGLIFQVEFPQPQHLRRMALPERQSWWSLSNLLKPGALVCLMLAGTRVGFCTVTEAPDEQTHLSKRGHRHQEGGRHNGLWKSPKNAFITLAAVGSDESTLRSIFGQSTCASPLFSMVEFPGVLLPSFEPTLRALQRMKTASYLPFENLLVPPVTGQANMPAVPPPLYSLSSGFQFNLRCLTNNDTDLLIDPNEPFDSQNLCRNSSLDKTQAKALVDSLQHSIGLIQGPPGTGKSFTGIALIKALLANNHSNRDLIGPILCISYTNHALDQLLEALLSQRITTNIVRIGSQSQSEQLQDCNLRNVAKRAAKTKGEKSSQFKLRSELTLLENKFSSISCGQIPAKGLPSHLHQHYPTQFRQFFGEDKADLNVSAGQNNTATVIQAWLTSGPVSRTAGRPFDDLKQVSVHDMSRPERLRVHQQWMEELKETRHLEAIELASAHADAKHNWGRIRSEVDLRCLAEAEVIGVTTSGLARNLDMLQKLQAKVILCEEAGEVLEAHLLTALLPSIEHAILIGDHLQLRPQVQNYELSKENPHGGDKYSLDVSLFERLVGARGSLGSGLPYTTLATQRRMHPSISQLVRDTLYPELKDAREMSMYPEVSGMKKRLYWLDHRVYEEATGGDPISTSRWNQYEIEMAIALVNHLVSQGEYKRGDIAILTPYLGQLHRLQQKLSQQFAVCVSERDQEQLQNQGLEMQSNPTSMRANLLDTLRVATIDNFQGEEAKIVVVSLVRSNPQTYCGFLKTSNRINVLLSRAQHGMYILGNSETSVHVPMWSQVIQILKEANNIGPCLELKCARHPATSITVSEPGHFLQFSPEGGCNLRCDNRLACGHACEQRCHSDMLHDAVFCGQPCTRLRQGCTHPCPEICGSPCLLNCMEVITREGRKLQCGHVQESLPCWQDQDTTKFLCNEMVQKVVPRCKHDVSVPCSSDISSVSYKCPFLCGVLLPCGHTCKRNCYECHTTDDIDHGDCQQRCGRGYSTCTHTCVSKCHRKLPCPPCQAACEVRCSHSKCTQKCCDPCIPCAEEKCRSVCPHSKCTMPCAAPCNQIPCSRRCERNLRCGHQCPSVCGQKCPPPRFCQICAKTEIKCHLVDFILGQAYKDVDLDNYPCIFPQCGHFLTMESMDGQMDLGKYYNLDEQGKPISIKDSTEPFRMEDIKACAQCRGHLRDISRYGRLVRQALIDQSTKKFILFLNREYMPLAEDLTSNIQRLQHVQYKQKISLPAVVRIQGARSNQIEAMKGAIGNVAEIRWGDMLKLRERIHIYRDRVSMDKQPFIKVLNIIENARRRQNLPMDDIKCGSEALQTKGSLLATSLSIRLDITLTMDFLRMKARNRVKVTIDLEDSRKECESFIEAAQGSKRPTLEAEGYLYLSQFHALQRCHCANADESQKHLDKGRAALQDARTIIDNYPSQTRGLGHEVDGAENMLLSTFYLSVTRAERLIVIQAMANEFVGTGHWYYCQNGHPFTIGECGGAMEESTCPECGAPVGGRQHRVAEGVTRAEDLEGSAERGNQ